MSLRLRTTLLVAVVAALVLVGGAVTLDLVLRHRLTASADDLARSRVTDLLALARTGDLPEVLVNVTDDSVAQVVDDQGRVVAASVNAAGAGPLTDEPATGGLRLLEVVGPDDTETEHYRLWTSTGPSAQGRVRVYVGTSLESVREATANLRRALLVGVPLVWALLVAATWLLVGRALRRLDRIRAEVDLITDSDLGRRVDSSGRDDEVGRLATTMNRMLDRLERAAERQRRFVADVSHDLRSPLTAERAQLELAMAAPDSLDDAALHRDLLGHVGEMEALVDDLLFLVTTEDAGPREHRPLDLEDLVLEEAERTRRLTDVHVDASGVSAAPVVGDATDLRRLVRNLVENAVAHATSTVVLRAAVQRDDVVLDVLDDGPGVPTGEADLVFERFHRGDAARSRRGSGLGLSIARTVAERHGGSLLLVVDDRPGAHFRLTLPVQNPLPGPPA